MWTDEKTDLLVKYWTDGDSMSQIAGKLGDGITRNAVIGKVHRLGLGERAEGTKRSSDRTKMKPRKSASDKISRPKVQKDTSSKKPAPRVDFISPLPPLQIPPTCYTGLEAFGIFQPGTHVCHWPIGDTGTDEFRFCGIPAEKSGSYCMHHARMAYQPISDRRRDISSVAAYA